MKCKYCEAEWIADLNIYATMAICPCCGKFLLLKKETISTIADVLLKINQLLGIDALTDNSRLVACFYDLAPQFAKQRRLLKYFADCNGPKKIVSVMHASKGEQTACVGKIVNEMKNEMFIEESAAQMICDAFLFAVTNQQVTATKLDATAQKLITIN